MKKLQLYLLTCLAIAGAFYVFYDTENEVDAEIANEDQGQPITRAIAILYPTKDSMVKGHVTFTAVDGGIRVVADVEGLKPGEHGFHIHEHGDCSADDASSAGGHFNPTGMPHGGPDSPKRHVGDLGNITAEANGHAHYERVDKIIQLNGPNSIVGRSMIVHADRDDFVSQPAGNSGKKLACGVIER